jgi:mercuric reductase
MLTDDYDYIIIGGGTAGFAAAIRANKREIRTAMINKGPIGGTCVNVGCMPSKLLLAIGEEHFRSGNPLFPSVNKERDDTIDVLALVKEKDRVVSNLRKRKYEKVLRELPSVDYIKGKVSFTGPNELKVGKKTLRSEKFLIATGSSPHVPPFEGLDGAGYWTSLEALSPRRIPESLIVIGGRVLGLEFAQLYSHLGSKVTILQRSARVLPESEPEVSEHITKYLVEEGIRILTGAEIRRVQSLDGKKMIELTRNGRKEDVEAEEILLATGRAPNIDALNFQAAGVMVENNGIKVDAQMRTSNPNIFAAGDVLGNPMLETVAAREGYIAAENALTNAGLMMDWSSVPSTVFTTPAVSQVGLTDAKARDLGYKCICRTIPLSSVPKARLIGDPRGLVKLVVEEDSHRILGVHVVAKEAGDIIHEGVLAVKFGLTLEQIIDTVHVYPTLSEGIKLAAQSFFEDIEKLTCCTY